MYYSFVDTLLLSNAHYISLTAFITVLISMGLWERIAPQRQRRVKQSKRWINNLSLVFFNTIIVRLFLPITLVSFALYCQNYNWGILNFLSVPYTLKIIISFIVFDFVIYIQHILFHRVPILWKLHQVHHADLDLDVTSGLRFHSLEIILSMFIKYTLIVLLGPPLLAVVLFEVILNACAMFNHANVKIPKNIDKILRWLIVTPDMHRIHHSTDSREINSNYGFNLTWWDRLLGTYILEPHLGQKNMNIGLNYIQNEKEATQFFSLLKIPFTKKTDGPINNADPNHSLR